MKILLLTISIIFGSCSINSSKKNNDLNTLYSKKLFEKYFSIVVPENYKIEKFNGPDFIIY